MEDLEVAEGSIQGSPLPEALDDAEDPLRPEIEEENDADAPIAVPDQDVEVTEDKDDLSDDDSILSEIDEAQFDAFDPSAVSIEERPVPVDENNIALIGTHKRKRVDGEGAEGRKKKREGKREKSKKSRAPRDEDEDADVDGGESRKASRRKRDVGEDGERRRARKASPDEDTLTPEESKYGEIRAIDESLTTCKDGNERLTKLWMKLCAIRTLARERRGTILYDIHAGTHAEQSTPLTII